MKQITKISSIGALAVAATLFLGTGSLSAQNQPGGGDFDPAQMRQRMMERMREQFEVTDDAEWKLISERITAVMDAQRATRSGGGGFGGPGGPGGGRPPGGGGGDNQGGGRGGPRGPGGPGGFTREPNPEADALQKAIEAKASPDEIKAKLARLRDSRKEKEAKLEKAQEDLKQVLSAKQEATAVMAGLLK